MKSREHERCHSRCRELSSNMSNSWFLDIGHSRMSLNVIMLAISFQHVQYFFTLRKADESLLSARMPEHGKGWFWVVGFQLRRRNFKNQNTLLPRYGTEP
jgi:hypothetical protein